jgi:hypothetical protein
MARLSITIELDNDAFQENDRDFEVARILGNVIERVESGLLNENTSGIMGTLRDVNGNTIGALTLDI